MGELVKLPNIAEKMEQQLARVGITTAAQLRDVGSREAWLRIQVQDASACYNRLCGLEGAIQGVRWHHLPEETKAELKVFYQAHKLPRPAGKPGKNAPTEKEETGAG